MKELRTMTAQPYEWLCKPLLEDFFVYQLLPDQRTHVPVMYTSGSQYCVLALSRAATTIDGYFETVCALIIAFETRERRDLVFWIIVLDVLHWCYGFGGNCSVFSSNLDFMDVVAQWSSYLQRGSYGVLIIGCFCYTGLATVTFFTPFICGLMRFIYRMND